MEMTDCPKCGFHQRMGPECLRCGLIFARYRSVPGRTVPSFEPKAGQELVRSCGGLPGRIYRGFRWITLAVLILVLVLILVPSAPPKVSYTAENVRAVEEKIQDFQQSAREGRPDSLAMDEPELNAWLGQNLALKGSEQRIHPSPLQTPESAISLAKKALAPDPSTDPRLEQVQSSVRDVKVQLRGDSMRVHTLFELYGKSLSLELEGKVTTRDGYLRFEPSSGKLGSLPLPGATLRRAVDRLFESPENREKFRLPQEIEDIRVEERKLIVSAR